MSYGGHGWRGSLHVSHLSFVIRLNLTHPFSFSVYYHLFGVFLPLRMILYVTKMTWYFVAYSAFNCVTCNEHQIILLTNVLAMTMFCLFMFAGQEVPSSIRLTKGTCQILETAGEKNLKKMSWNSLYISSSIDVKPLSNCPNICWVMLRDVETMPCQTASTTSLQVRCIRSGIENKVERCWESVSNGFNIPGTKEMSRRVETKFKRNPTFLDMSRHLIVERFVQRRFQEVSIRVKCMELHTVRA